VANPAIAKGGAPGPPAATYYYVVIPAVTTQAGISPDHTFYVYKPQYYGKRSTELSIVVNGSEEVQLTWDALAGVDYFVIMRSKIQGDYKRYVRDGIWYIAGNLTAFTDNGQAFNFPWSLNIPPRKHGCYVVADTAYVFFSIFEDQRARGEDAIYTPIIPTDWTKEYGLVNRGDPVHWVWCNIHIQNNATLSFGYAYYYEKMVLHSGDVFVNNGGKFVIGVSPNGITWVFDRGSYLNKFWASANAEITFFASQFQEMSVSGWNYVDLTFGCILDWYAVTMPTIRGCDISTYATGNIKRITRTGSYYGTRPVGTPSMTGMDDIKCQSAGEVIFLYANYSFELRNFEYIAPHATPYDVRFFNNYTGTCVLVNPTFKTGTPVPNVWTNPWAGPFTGSCSVRFELDLKVVDTDGTPIDGASVKIYNKDGGLMHDLTTGVDGTITTTDIEHALYEPALTLDGPAIVSNRHPHRLYISKAGYREVDYDLVIDHRTDMTIPMTISGGGPPGAVVEVTDTTATVTCPSTTAVVEVKES